MLDRESKETYQNIRLQRDLRCAILERHQSRRHFSPGRMMRPAAALASLMLVLSVCLLIVSHTGSGVYLDGSPVTPWAKTALPETVEYAAGVMRAFSLPDEAQTQPRHTAEGCIPLTVKFGQDVSVTVSGGTLLLPGADGTPTFAGQSGFAPDGAVIYWIPGDSPSPMTAQFSDTDGNPLAALTLTYDDGDAAWRIASAKIKNNK